MAKKKISLKKKSKRELRGKIYSVRLSGGEAREVQNEADLLFGGNFSEAIRCAALAWIRGEHVK
jgi:hypothetical protein